MSIIDNKFNFLCKQAQFEKYLDVSGISVSETNNEYPRQRVRG